ncbi:endonuclease/exonuclease/phosphatase family protein [uncultured Tateyamaria sp.]|uniref:endonuclease/exonuclease/phosphatase family protein n=1 Tax=uncultured Tateyamaria sp. TaxID=455651 RepID=UPI0026216CC4|nr:endonuclease/exonuclease/phosphatase family protein [uncultured Tateyamaria sp.]
MRIATYNIEWMNSLFADDGSLLDDGGWSSRHDVTRADQIAALGVVFRALDADAVMVIEAPDDSRSRSAVPALETFASHAGLRARKAIIGFANDTQQEIALLYDPDVMRARHDPQTHAGAPAFDDAFAIDLDIDATQDRVVFSKPPLELAIETAAGFQFRMIGAHLKSKAPHGATNRDEVLRISIANRRKQLAQAIWLRARIAAHLDQGTPLMLMGDLNDGPGLDEYEHLFGRSSVEIILGDGATTLFDPHARTALQRRLGAAPTTARFWIRQEKRFLQALLDYIMVSPDLAARDGRWRIWHPLDDPECWAQPMLRDALVTASDHFPVSLDIAL